MGGKNEALAKRFEVKVQEAMATLEKLTDGDWKKVTDVEKWPVGVTAHHFAGVPEQISKMVEALVAGQSLDFTSDMIDKRNAKHAKDYVNCTKAETIELLKKGAAIALAVIRGLSDDQLAKSGIVFSDAPPMTAEQLITGGLLNHIDAHFGSIRKTVRNS